MKSPKLFLLIDTMSKKDLISCQEFLNSDFATKDKLIPKLFKEAIKIKNWKELEYTSIKQKLYIKIYASTFNNQKITNKISDLNLVIEKFIYWKSLEQNDFNHKITLINYYKSNGAQELFIEEFRKIKKTVQSSTADKSSNRKRQITQLRYFDPSLSKYDKKTSAKVFDDWQKQTENLALQILLELELERKTREIVLQKPRSNFIGEKILSALNHKLTSSENKIIRLYSDFIRMITTFNEKDFTIAKNNFLLYYARLSRSVKANLATSLINFTSLKNNQGQIEFKRLGLELYKNPIIQNALIEDGFISSNNFQNAIILASELGELGWAKSFLKKNLKHISTDNQGYIQKICSGYINFNQGKYMSAGIALASIESFQNVGDALRVKSLMVRCFYETENNLNLISHHILAYRRFLNRNNQIDHSFIKSNLNFLTLVSEMYKLKTGVIKVQEKQVEKLRNMLHGFDVIICKNWLNQKLNEFDKISILK